LVGDEEEKRKKRVRPVITKKIRKMLEEDGYSSGEAIISKKLTRKKHEMFSKNSNNFGKLSCRIDEKLVAAASDEDIDISPFKVSNVFCRSHLEYSILVCMLVCMLIRMYYI